MAEKRATFTTAVKVIDEASAKMAQIAAGAARAEQAFTALAGETRVVGEQAAAAMQVVAKSMAGVTAEVRLATTTVQQFGREVYQARDARGRFAGAVPRNSPVGEAWAAHQEAIAARWWRTQWGKVARTYSPAWRLLDNIDLPLWRGKENSMGIPWTHRGSLGAPGAIDEVLGRPVPKQGPRAWPGWTVDDLINAWGGGGGSGRGGGGRGGSGRGGFWGNVFGTEFGYLIKGSLWFGLMMAITETINGLKRFMVESVKTAGEFERLRVGIQVQAGGVGRGNQIFSQLKQMAFLPGMGMQQGAGAVLQLSAAGMQPEFALRFLKEIANQAALSGKSVDDVGRALFAVTQILGKGGVKAEELHRQLYNALPIMRKVMSEAFGSFDAPAINSSIENLEDFFQRWQKAMEGSERAPETLANDLKNLGEAANIAKAAFGSGFMDSNFGKWLRAMPEDIRRSEQAMQAFGRTAGRVLSNPAFVAGMIANPLNLNNLLLLRQEYNQAGRQQGLVGIASGIERMRGVVRGQTALSAGRDIAAEVDERATSLAEAASEMVANKVNEAGGSGYCARWVHTALQRSGLDDELDALVGGNFQGNAIDLRRMLISASNRNRGLRVPLDQVQAGDLLAAAGGRGGNGHIAIAISPTQVAESGNGAGRIVSMSSFRRTWERHGLMAFRPFGEAGDYAALAAQDAEERRQAQEEQQQEAEQRRQQELQRRNDLTQAYIDKLNRRMEAAELAAQAAGQEFTAADRQPFLTEIARARGVMAERSGAIGGAQAANEELQNQMARLRLEDQERQATAAEEAAQAAAEAERERMRAEEERLRGAVDLAGIQADMALGDEEQVRSADRLKSALTQLKAFYEGIGDTVSAARVQLELFRMEQDRSAEALTPAQEIIAAGPGIGNIRDFLKGKYGIEAVQVDPSGAFQTSIGQMPTLPNGVMNDGVVSTDAIHQGMVRGAQDARAQEAVQVAMGDALGALFRGLSMGGVM